ncbi:MAG: hypothetical protein MI867_06285 [Pseudomonadales bacterium]|nr:hypothetical protein [Pseudomonadales bacterium]
MANTRRIVEEELGKTDTAALISAAIQILANENFDGASFPDEKVIHLTWKAKHMVETNAKLLHSIPTYEQQNIIKLYLEGQPVSDYLKDLNSMEAMLQF